MRLAQCTWRLGSCKAEVQGRQGRHLSISRLVFPFGFPVCLAYDEHRLQHLLYLQHLLATR